MDARINLKGLLAAVSNQRTDSSVELETVEFLLSPLDAENPRESRGLVGFIHVERVLPAVMEEDSVFCLGKDPRTGANYVTFKTQPSNVETRTRAVNGVLTRWREANRFRCLKKWRDEQYPVYAACEGGSAIAFTIERAGAQLFGVRTYGCHLNGFYYGLPGDGTTVQMWIAKRSATKATFPGYLDNLAGGGLQAYSTPEETVVRESAEEAGLSIERRSLTCSGVITMATTVGYEGVRIESEYVYDYPLHRDWVPHCTDGEVESFECLPIDRVLELVVQKKFMPESAMVVIDFCFRHGILTPENIANYSNLFHVIHQSVRLPYPQFL